VLADPRELPHHPMTMREWADFTLEHGGEGGATIALSGPLRVWSLGDIDTRLDDVADAIVRVDLSRVSDIDTTGAWFAWRLAQSHGAALTGAGAQAQRLIAAIGNVQESQQQAGDEAGLVDRVTETIGAIVSAWGAGAVRVIGFLGALIVATAATLPRPARWRSNALFHQMQLVGVDSIGIIGLMSFLVGIVIAQQGAVQLREFGAEVYTINLTGRLALRELGILMTAIMVAGRSGSAFAAQIGTMRLTEEVDAMRTIGVSPMEALVIPRVLAAMLMMPLLGFYASVIAIVGGAFISTVQLGIPFITFLSRIQEVVPLYDLWVGMIKAPVFGLIIALSGCYQGMQVKSNSEEVGQRTTMAVVAAIFMVIVLDAFFAVFFTQVRACATPLASTSSTRTSTSPCGAARSSAWSADRAPASRC